MLYPRPRKGKKYHEVSRKIDNLAETARTFDRMVTVRKMKQIVPECKCKKSGDEGMDTKRILQLRSLQLVFH